jgi:hypothetical protein
LFVIVTGSFEESLAGQVWTCVQQPVTNNYIKLKMNTLSGVSTTKVLSDKKQPKEIFHVNQTVTPGVIM